MAAAGSFAAVASIFGSPVIGAVLIIEAAGLGGADPPARAAARPARRRDRLARCSSGSGSFSGFSTAAWALSPFPLPPFGGPGWGDFAWTIVLVGRRGGRRLRRSSSWRGGRSGWSSTQPFVLTVAAGLAVGGLAIAFAEATGESPNAVLFSGEEAFGTLFGSAAAVSMSTLVLLLLFKSLAWSISLGKLPWRPDVPGDLPRSRRGPHGAAPAGLRRDAGRRRADRRPAACPSCACRSAR